MKNFVFVLGVVVSLSALGGCKNKVVRSPSGFEVTFHKRNGGAIPKMGEFVYFDYSVKKDSQLLFASNERGQQMKFKVTDPSKFGAQEKPIVEALMMMSKGDSVSIVQKLDTLKVKPNGFAGAKLLTIIVTLKDIVTEDKFMADLDPMSRKQYLLQKSVDGYMTSLAADTAKFIKRDDAVKDSTYQLAIDFKAGKLTGKVQATKSGLKYIILRPGTGAAPQTGQLAAVHYYGTLSEGRKFDDSYIRGQPIAFPIGQGQVIKGWDEGIALLKEGTTAVLFVPSELGYGKSGQPGAIPPGENLVFYVELLKVLGTPEPAAPNGAANAMEATPPSAPSPKGKDAKAPIKK